MWSFRRRARALACAGIALGCLAVASPATATGSALPVGTMNQGLSADLSDPSGMPPGMNNWSCQPSADHPYPVILLHGTWLNEATTWQALSPMLVNAGYCVFGLNYGKASTGTNGRVYAIGDITKSAAQLAGFVGQVLTSTHASQVDIVGHSQGGMMPRYYMKFLGGAPLVHMLVGLAPSNHGTTLSALVMEETSMKLGLSANGCIACTEQRVGSGSTFLSTLNAGGDTVPGPAYVVIETSHRHRGDPLHVSIHERARRPEHPSADTMPQRHDEPRRHRV